MIFGGTMQYMIYVQYCPYHVKKMQVFDILYVILTTFFYEHFWCQSVFVEHSGKRNYNKICEKIQYHQYRNND